MHPGAGLGRGPFDVSGMAKKKRSHGMWERQKKRNHPGESVRALVAEASKEETAAGLNARRKRPLLLTLFRRGVFEIWRERNGTVMRKRRGT